MSQKHSPQTVKEVQQKISRLHDHARNHEEDYHQIKAVKEISKLLFVKLAEESRYEGGEKDRFRSGEMHEAESAQVWINKLYTDHIGDEDSWFDSDKIELSNKTIEKSVEDLEELYLGGSDIDVKGVAYEKILEDIFREELGQFFTPREVVKFMIGMLDPVYNPENGNIDTVIDPAVGSGGFLIEVLNHYSRQAGTTIDFEVASNNVYGIDKTSWLLQICNTNLNLHSEGSWQGFEHIYHGNSLQSAQDGIPVQTTSGSTENVRFNSFDKLIANPPFGSEEDEELAMEFYDSTDSVHREVEALFIKRSLELVKPGGEIAIVVPKTLIKGPKFADLREWIWENAIINASIHLPLVTFRPFKSEIQTAILHLTKRDGNMDQGPIYFDAATYVGHDGKGYKIQKNDLPAILSNYLEWRES